MPKLPETMTVVAITEPGGLDKLVVAERPLPVAGEHEILVRVAAAGVNRPDVLQRLGRHPPPASAPPDVPGLEIAGEVVALGPGAARHRLGDAVTALVPGGGYAGYCKVHETNALPVPDGFSMVEAAAIPETFFTVWPNLFDRGRLAAGETVLVHGGTSGIGTVAIQLATAFGARAIATAGSAAKCDACLRLGAIAAINYREEDFVARVAEITGGHGADVIFDLIGGDYVMRNYAAAAEEGRIVQIGLQHGGKVEIDLGRMMNKRLTHTGSGLRHRPVELQGIGRRSAAQESLAAIGGAQGCAGDQFRPFRSPRRQRPRHAWKRPQHIGKIVLTA